ncbi:MAG: sulfite exporter TauE/SafE family protein [Gaiellaceae bacterium]
MSFGFGTAVALVLLGFGVGAFGTLVGAGGGFILTPILLLLYPHDSPKTLTAITLLAVFFNAASGTVAYARQRRTDFRSGTVFAAATVPGAIAGALVVGHVSRAIFDPIMGAMLAVLAVWLSIGNGTRSRRAGRRWTVNRDLVDARGERHSFDVALVHGAVYSLGVGFISSFFGIGGGVIHVPLLVRALGYPVHIATATSHFILAVMAGTGTITHLVTGNFQHGHGLRRALALSLGVVAGAQLGARISLGLSADVIQRLLAVALAVLAIRLLVL